MSRLRVHKLKKDKVKTFLDWAKRLSTDLAEEARLSIIEEQVIHEHFGMVEIAGEFYLVSNMEGENILPPNLDRPINVEHRKILKDCTDVIIPVDVIIDIKA